MKRQELAYLAEDLRLEGAWERLRPSDHRALEQIARRRKGVPGLRPPIEPNLRCCEPHPHE